jgi:hypothetical protein
MNPANLSAKEVLRMCIPETDLEKRLFELVTELESDAADLQSDLDRVSNDLDQYDCDTCHETTNEIELAISVLESGKADECLKILKAI